MRLINQYSLILVGLPLVGLIFYLLLRGDGSRMRQLVAVGLLAALVAGYFAFRPGGLATRESTAGLQHSVSGKPTLVEFYSEY